MDKRTDKKFVDPVIDQQIIKQKKGKGIWWLLLAIIIIILAIWFSTQRNNNDAAPAPSSSSSAMSQPAQQPAATNESTSPAAPAADSDNTLTALQQYYAGEGNDDSQWIDLDQVSFATGNAAPSVTDEQSLNQVASLISQHPDHSIIVRGFTDSTGNEAINQPLSGQRANAIKDWLTQHGVDGSKITIDGQGADHAVANNDTAQGRDQNRRVAIQVKAAQ